MARTKEFDREAVLDRAMRLFWRQGYEATSMQDLVEAMGIGRQSLYDTFGDKRGLYLAAVERYARVEGGPLFAPLAEPGAAKDAIRRTFAGLVEIALRDGKLGCLSVNAAVERAACDPDIARWVAANLAAGERGLRLALERAQALGEIGPHSNPQALARFLFSAIQGLRVTAKATTDRATLNDIVRVTLSVLD